MSKPEQARIWTLNYQFLNRVLSECAADVEALGVEVKEFFVLAEIEECRYPAELAIKLVLPKPTLTVYLKNLVAKQFVAREIDPDDLRRHRLVLTPAGADVLERALAILSARFDARLTRLDAGERDDLARMLETLSG
ncbi:MarR family winged helix-turn-helix transcriptional regulator [Catenuloplanes japonicus]|uniref:MarR family winged helix-turn-helix transcriptional regulator n=1 Tax=Catenuloplanes japonicus TaxID=33876 RepID=UPI00052539D2|nr:MarR family transcriptional regulator [Catenuloplanes japonicus]